MQFADFKNTQVFFTDRGTGTPLILLHGYLESSAIWGKFGTELEKYFRVITVDLPGHGKSESFGRIQTMEMMSDAVYEVVRFLGISDAVIAGHSMGGYVALAFAERHKESVKGLVLLHTTPFADTDEKKQNRNREIGLVLQGKKDLIYNVNIPKAFADCNLEEFANQIDFGREIARNTPDEGIIAVLEGMKLRPDRTQLLKNIQIPVLFVAGKKDNYIPMEASREISGLSENIQHVFLEKSGHMGFIEERTQCLYSVVSFVNEI